MLIYAGRRRGEKSAMGVTRSTAAKQKQKRR
jgi:hypothetical protein